MTASLFDPAEFFRLAQELLAAQEHEAYLRTAINRAYYACFHLALISCRRKWSWVAPDYGQHRGVIRKLREQRLTHLARQLDSLLVLREQADYDLAVTVSRIVAVRALATAADVIPRLRSL